MLEEKIVLASNNHQRAKLVSDFLQAQLKNVRTEHTTISSYITAIVNSYHTSSVETLADTHFLSLRQFERRFKEMSGFSPKFFLRIMRFNSVLNKDFQHKPLTEMVLSAATITNRTLFTISKNFQVSARKNTLRRKRLLLLIGVRWSFKSRMSFFYNFDMGE